MSGDAPARPRGKVVASQHHERFNHDEDAPGYDADVADESDPIRAGYGELLAWVVEQSQVHDESDILELGSGTGNLTAQLPPLASVLCVDVSEEMTRRAAQKLSLRPRVEFVRADILEIFSALREESFDSVISTYTVHHLTDPEREVLFRETRRVLRPGGRAVFGDLMFEDEAAAQAILARYRETGAGELADEIEEEFFWNLEHCKVALAAAGFAVEAKRFSELSWGVLGH